MKFFDNYFVFSTSEKKGVIWFVVLVLLLCSFYWVMPYVFKRKPRDYSAQELQFLKDIELKTESEVKGTLFAFDPNKLDKDSLMLLGLSAKQSYNVLNYRKKIGDFKDKSDFKRIYSISDSLYNKLEPYLLLPYKSKKETPRFNNTKSENQEVADYQLFDFDPNTVNEEQLKQLGFSAKQANTFLNFRSKGGKFYHKEDLKKVYSVTDKLYGLLEPYITFEEKNQKFIAKESKSTSLNINTVKAYQIEKALGVSKKLSYTILNYRTKLGGFYSVSQLYEVYGLDSVKHSIEEIDMVIDKSELVKININKATFKELVNHPYLSFSDVKKIVNYREMHGDFATLEQILENNLINPKQYRKIAPYLILE